MPVVRERQVLLTIPDTTQMGVQVSVHESFVEQVSVEQDVRIAVDAFPDRPLFGKVHKIAVLPDAQNRWLNPDLKVYKTMIAIEGQHGWLRPGLSARAEIIIATLDDVVYVPVQAVRRQDGSAVVFVRTVTGSERREVELGLASDICVEIKSGLKEGETVFLQIPETESRAAGASKSDEEPDESASERA